MRWHREVDVLVNTAGARLPSPLGEKFARGDGWSRNLELDLVAPADLCRAAILHFRSTGGGIIVYVADYVR